jgi:hypothetical protein
MRARRSPLAVLVLALAVLTALPLYAAPSASALAESPRLLSGLFDLLADLHKRLGFVWQMEGSGVDPFGGRGTPPTPPTQGAPGSAGGSSESLLGALAGG